MRINDFNATGFDSVIEPSLIAKMENGSNSATLVEKSITENGEYNASDDNASGYSSVTVNVPSAPTPETHQVTLSCTVDGSGISFSSSETFSDIVDIINNGDIIDFTIVTTYQGQTISYSPVAYKYDTSSKIIKVLGDLYSEEESAYAFMVVYWGDPSVYETQTVTPGEGSALTIM